ncbi:hypothetical protein BH11PSE2_BH11PSE2_18960 [soil metagenome]
MKRAIVLLLGSALCAGTLALPLLSQAADAKAPAAKAAVKAYKAPRTSFGQPDLGDYWSNASITSESRPGNLGDRLVYTPEEVKKLENEVATEVEVGNKGTDPNAPPPTVGGDKVPAGIRQSFAAADGASGGYDRGWLDPGASVMRVNGEPRTSFITTQNGRAPAKKAGAPTYPGRARTPGMGAYDNPENLSLGERCIISFGRNAGPPMFPNGFYNNNYHFSQSPSTVVIEVEMVHDVRVVRLNAKHRTDDVRPYMGDSIGWWEGDTLVVETNHIPQAQAYNGAWKDLTVTEKFTRVGDKRLHYQFIINDPTMWEKPWGGEYEMMPLNGRTMEYACHEGNYALEGILAGAREDERVARTKTAAAAPR